MKPDASRTQAARLAAFPAILHMDQDRPARRTISAAGNEGTGIAGPAVRVFLAAATVNSISSPRVRAAGCSASQAASRASVSGESWPKARSIKSRSSVVESITITPD